MRSHYKIIHTSGGQAWGEKEKRIFNESIWMNNNGHEVIIVTSIDSPLLKKAKEFDIKVYGLSFKWFSKIKDKNSLNRIIYNEKPDIINTHGSNDSKIALSAAKKNKVALRIRTKHNADNLKNSWANRIVFKKYSHYTFTTTRAIKDNLQKVFKLKDMEIFAILGGLEEDAPQSKEQQIQLDTMGRDIIRIYRLHQVKLERQYL